MSHKATILVVISGLPSALKDVSFPCSQYTTVAELYFVRLEVYQILTVFKDKCISEFLGEMLLNNLSSHDFLTSPLIFYIAVFFCESQKTLTTVFEAPTPTFVVFECASRGISTTFTCFQHSSAGTHHQYSYECILLTSKIYVIISISVALRPTSILFKRFFDGFDD